MSVLKISAILCCLGLLQGCELGFVVENTQNVSKTLGISESYNLKRNHHLVFSKASRFSIVAMSDAKAIQQSLLDCADLAFSRYFTAHAISDAPGLNYALKLAQDNGDNFLVRVKVLAGEHAEGKAMGKVNNYTSLDLVMDVYDVNSKVLADKIQFTVEKGIYPKPLEEVLGQSMLAVVRELVGDT